MVRLLAVLVLAVASVKAQTITTQSFGAGTNAFSIDFVAIGNPGNAADDTGFGSVAYAYNLGKFEISRDQINKANEAGGLGITLFDMTSYGGNGGSLPAFGMTWNEAARFVNWLNISQGYQAAYNFTTSGVNESISLWSIEDSAQNGLNRFRHKDAFYFLPNRDEWYKAAYGSPSGTWYNYPSGSDGIPIAVSSGVSAGTAVYGQPSSLGPAEITNAGGLSPFETMAQGGNATEWIESAFDGTNDLGGENREIRGGNYTSNSIGLGGGIELAASFRISRDPTLDFHGFRVASVPEPSSLFLLLAGGAVLMAGRWRRG